MDASTLQLIILPAGIIAILFAIYLARDVLARDTGTQAMQDVAGTIYEGAVAFIRRQYTTIGDPRRGRRGRHRRRHRASSRRPTSPTCRILPDCRSGFLTGFAFLVGAACSMASGIIGMFIAVKANVRTASAARRSLVEAVQVAMRGGAVSGLPRRRPVAARRVGHLHRLFDLRRRSDPSPRRRSSSSASASGRRSWRSSRSSAAASTPRPPTSAPTSSARSRRASPRTTPATRASSRTSSATTSATAPAVAPTSSNRPPPRTSAR